MDFKHPLDVMIFVLGLSKCTPVRRRHSNEDTVTVCDFEMFSLFLSRKVSRVTLSNGLLTFLWKGKQVIMYYDGPDSLGDLLGTFGLEEYNRVDLDGKTVIDVGANVGDSALFFLLNGANKVICIEPFPYAFRLLQSNIVKNNLSQMTTCVHAGVGKEGHVDLSKSDTSWLASTIESPHFGTDSISVPILPLKTILLKYVRDCDDLILKIDCEGCEYDAILLADNETLRRFSNIIIEYHFGFVDLRRKLTSACFEVTLERITTFVDFNKPPLASRGLLTANRLQHNEFESLRRQ